MDSADVVESEQIGERMQAEGVILEQLSVIARFWRGVRFTMDEETQRAFDSWLCFQCRRALPPLADQG